MTAWFNRLCPTPYTPVINENSVRISTSIVDAHWLPCCEAHRSLKTGSLCLARRARPGARSACRGRIRFWITQRHKVWSSKLKRSGISVFSLKERNRRGSRLAPAKRRVAGIGGVVPRPEESLPRDPVPVVPLLWAPGRLCPKLNGSATADSRQNICAEFHAVLSHSIR